MRKSYYVAFMIGCLVLLLAVLLFSKRSAPAITYFPLDTDETFQKAKNALQMQQSDDTDMYTVSWKNRSETDEPFYLRQDVSVIFKDGVLIGVKSKWKEDAKTIDFNETFDFSRDHMFQTISLHYGEKHYSDEDIKSLQQMSYDEIYVKAMSEDKENRFQEVTEQEDEETQNDLKNNMQENLLQHWHRLTSHYKMDLAQYEVVPLTELHQFENQILLSYTKEQTDEIIAKLWEGLYKNYIIPASETKNNENKNYVPLILFGKHEQNIYVLFELNGEMKKLKQAYPDF